MLKRICGTIASILLVGAIFASPHIYEHIQFDNGTMVKVVAVDDVRPTAQGGWAKHFTVQDHDGNTYDVYTGRVAQWSKSEGDYINSKYLKGGN